MTERLMRKLGLQGAVRGKKFKIIGKGNPTDETWVKELGKELIGVGGDVHYWLKP